jgi:hypothetical protein
MSNAADMYAGVMRRPLPRARWCALLSRTATHVQIKRFNYDWVQAIAQVNNVLYPESAAACYMYGWEEARRKKCERRWLTPVGR